LGGESVVAFFFLNIVTSPGYIKYPAAWDRGGIPADKENYVTFMAAVKTAFAPKKYGLTL
jgi:hypothetical protein